MKGLESNQSRDPKDEAWTTIQKVWERTRFSSGDQVAANHNGPRDGQGMVGTGIKVEEANTKTLPKENQGGLAMTAGWQCSEVKKGQHLRTEGMK